jgi:hypothetical protein
VLPRFSKVPGTYITRWRAVRQEVYQVGEDALVFTIIPCRSPRGRRAVHSAVDAVMHAPVAGASSLQSLHV